MSSAKPLLVGEDNPYGADYTPEERAHFALYPKPVGSAGGRLCHLVLGFRRGAEYLRHFDRVNLCSGRWSEPEARSAALAIIMEAETYRRPGIVLLGAKVTRAFGYDYPAVVWTRSDQRGGFPTDAPLSTLDETPIYFLPHPSGRCRAWNEAGAYERARRLLADLLPHEPEGGVG